MTERKGSVNICILALTFVFIADRLTLASAAQLLDGNSPSIAGALKERETAANYFLQYGYLEDFASSADETVFADSLKNFQKFAGLNVTGKLDEKTKKQFTIPRCGLTDPISKIKTRKRRYLLQGSKWDLNTFKDRTLTWRLENRGRTLARGDIRVQLRKAFAIWQKHGNINFRETAADKADIMVKFANSCHQDPYCFDFKGGTLAHAFYPYPGQDISGDVHFDNAEYYSIGGGTGTDLLWVAVHEIGHSLGLDHSNIKGSIMFPWYQGYKKDFDLTPDDRAGIQELYGAAIQKPPTTVKVTTQAPTTKAPAPTTKAPEPTTKAPAPTTKAPVPTTKAPAPTTKAPAPTTKAPVPTTKAPVPTTKAPAPTKKAPAPTTKAPAPTTKAPLPTTKAPAPKTEKPTAKPVTEKPIAPTEERRKKPVPATTAMVTQKPTAAPKTTNKNMRYRCPKFIDSSYISIRYKWMIIASGLWLYLANSNGIRHGPLVKRNYFPRIKGTIDSSLLNKVTGETIMFSGNRFYIYREFSHKAGPFPLTNLGFGKEIKKIDAALHWQRNNQYYIFANAYFWRFNPTKPGLVIDGYPKLIKDWWKGIPNYLSSAVTGFDYITRFTKGEQYYTLMDRAVKAEKSSPERIGVAWMQCRVSRTVPKHKVEGDDGPLAAEP